MKYGAGQGADGRGGEAVTRAKALPNLLQIISDANILQCRYFTTQICFTQILSYVWSASQKEKKCCSSYVLGPWVCYVFVLPFRGASNIRIQAEG